MSSRYLDAKLNYLFWRIVIAFKLEVEFSMKLSLMICFITLYSSFAVSGVITCGDAQSVGTEAKLALHASAQRRAQKQAEELVEKKINTPLVDAFGRETSPEVMASVIEVYWCESPSTPLHEAYFNFYTNNKNVFD